VCGWVGRESVVSWGDLWEVACLGVGEVIALARFPGCLDKTKTNQNENFSKMEEICKTRISQKWRKCTKPDLPKDPAKRKESQGKKIDNKTARATANPEQNPNKRHAKRRV